MAGNQDRLKYKFFPIGEGEAEGRFAIVALVVAVTIRSLVAVVIAAGAVSFPIKAFLP